MKILVVLYNWINSVYSLNSENKDDPNRNDYSNSHRSIGSASIDRSICSQSEDDIEEERDSGSS